FHGADVRKSFLSHLLKECGIKGINLFIDNEIPRGEFIGPELKKAIQGSRIAIVLLSKRYASSSWCLGELVEIMKCKEELGQTVMPVFYEVDPTDVKKQTGDFGKVFKKTCKGKRDDEVTRKWSQALAQVATLAGYHSKNWDNDVKMIEDVATEVANNLFNSTPSRDFDEFIGMEAHMTKISPVLRTDLDEVRMIGIWGPAGIGKTTIARCLFHQLSHTFQYSVFLMNVKTMYTPPICSDDYNVKLHLQQKLLSQLLNQKEDLEISHLGVAQERLKDKKVLVVLDNVDQLVQLEAMAKETGWFGHGSRILITTQDRKILKAHGITDIYKVDFPSDLELPSSIGNAIHLKKLDLSGCSSLIELPSSIGNATNLQFLSLSNCSSLVELPSSIGNAIHLKKLDLSGCSSLIELPSSIGNATNLQFLSLSNCSSLVELPSSIGNAIHLKKLDLSGCSSLIELPSSIGNATNLQFLSLSNCSSLVELPSSLGNATNLQFLSLSNCSSLVELPSSLGNAIRNLKELDFSRCSSLVGVPSSIGNATNLNRLDFSDCSSLVGVPSSIGNATNLNRLDFSDCSSLVGVPASIGNHQKLDSLILRECCKLEALPVNINLKFLTTLDLTDCSLMKCFPEISTNIEYMYLTGTAIKQVPSSISLWPRLIDLHMSYSENLKEFPHVLDTMTVLVMSNTEIQEIPPWIKRISRLRRLVLTGCKKLLSLPQLPSSLSQLDAKDCESLERLDCSFLNQKISLNFAKCFKLNKEARDVIIQTSTNDVTILPGKEMPNYFNYQANGGSLVMKLNERPSPSSKIWKACILLVSKDEVEAGIGQTVRVHHGIKQNSLDVPCLPSLHILFPPLTEHMYIFELEADVTSDELCFEFRVNEKEWMIKECGVHYVNTS
uniref:ADP-ribosyl cyclase/cyclic ADP-ribose hydrolase n=1 Tax=Brassica oleracea var. oleracea TaxID=109376 RepID=A0A0D3AFQ5_BRAOL